MLYLDGRDEAVEIPTVRSAKSLYFLHASKGSAGHGSVLASYEITYGDGTIVPIMIREGYEIQNFWGVHVQGVRGPARLDEKSARIAWQGDNPSWKNVGVVMYGWNNPHPEKEIQSIRIDPKPMRGMSHVGLMLLAISTAIKPWL